MRRLLTRAVAAVLFVSALACTTANAADIEQQRALFKQVFATVERGDWSPVDSLSAANRELLEQYVLWPDLRAAWLRANLKKAAYGEVNAFLDEYDTLRPARQLRYRFALQLARSGDLEDFQSIYAQFYEGQGVTRLDCLSLQADIAAERYARVAERALDFWLIGTSQVDECDPVFAYLEDEQLLGPAEYRKRFGLAIEAREFRLARWLAKKVDQALVDEANRWIRAQGDPDRYLARHDPSSDSENYRARLVYAAERLTYRDPQAALQRWNDVEHRYNFSEDQKLHTRRHIALWTARDNLPGAYALLENLPTTAQNKDVLRWRARTSLREGQWQRLLADITSMESEERGLEDWRYWEAIAMLRSGQATGGTAALEALSMERSYYGFLAADELGKDYTFESAALTADDESLAALAAHPGIVRARELFLVGHDSSGRAEWEAVIGHFDTEQKRHAAILADRWGWHSRAITTVASVGEYDDLDIRYPLPWKTEFESHSTAANIEPTWAYGIARSESLFMPDVRSGAGAVGLMQLMPGTGRMVARQIKLPYSGINTLTDPDSNIRLGTSYLAQMAERFDGHAVLATAAYNAGPHRVDAWLPPSGAEDARIWIENIPFNETRKYVKRVLAAQAIFHWRMTGQLRRVSNELRIVVAPDEARLAAR
jgi:soluble lytic murein transglycosylase